MQILQYVFALIVTLGVLVTVHELGHFLVARCPARRSCDFRSALAPSLFSRFDRRGTEFALAAVPLGGYVKILDEREGEVAAAEADKTFNRLSPMVAHRVCARRSRREFYARVRRSIGRCSSPAAPTSFRSSRSPRRKRLRSLRVCSGGEEIVSRRWRNDAVVGRSQHGAGVAARRQRLDHDREPPARARRHANRTGSRSTNWQRGVDEPELFRSLGLVPTLPPILGNDSRRRPGERGGIALVGSCRRGRRRADHAMGRLGRRRSRVAAARS